MVNVSMVKNIAAWASMVAVTIASSALYADGSRVSGIQLVRYVLETPTFPRVQYYSYYRKILRGKLVYDAMYRNPLDPAGPAPVDCDKTKRVGITFLVKRRTKLRTERITVQLDWTHSSLEWVDPEYREYITEPFLRGQDAAIFSGGLELTDDRKVDGVISVQVTRGVHKILANSFELADCEIT